MPASDFADVLSRILPFTEEDDRILLEPYNYLAQNSGKNVRSQLIEAFNFWLNVDPPELRIINKVVGMLHTSSLLMDDVEDSSVLRRGQPVAHLIYGVPQTINTANYVYFLAYQELLKLRPSPVAMRSAPPSASGSSSGGSINGRRSSSREDGNSSSSSSSSGSSRLRSSGRPSSSSNRQAAALKADKDRLITPPLSPRPGAGRVPTPGARDEVEERRAEAGAASSAALDAVDPKASAKETIAHRLGAKLGLRWDDEPSSALTSAPAQVAPVVSSSSPSPSSTKGLQLPTLPHRSSSSSSSTVVCPTATSTSMDGTATPPLATSTTSAGGPVMGSSALGRAVVASAIDQARKDDNLDRIVTEEMLSLHRGQGLELFWRDSLTCPTEDEYVKMVLGKTGGLFRIAIKLMMAKSACDVDLVPLVNLISIFFQIRDDYMNMQSSEYADNKNFAEDLTEGKFSFPIIHAIRENPASRIVINTLQKKPKDAVMLHHCVDFMRKETQSFAYTKDVLDTLGSAVRAELARVGALMGREGQGGENRMLEAIISKLEDIPV